MQLKYITFFSCLMIYQVAFGQTELCQNVYLWDFKTKQNERNFVTNTLSNEVEDILTQVNKCKVLQRRNYVDIQKQVENEKQISNVEGISYDLKRKLKTIQAERVLFGEIEQDFSFNVNLRLRLENLNTKELRTATILIEAKDMIEPTQRNQAIRKGLNKLLNFDLGGVTGSQTNPKEEYKPTQISVSECIIKIVDANYTSNGLEVDYKFFNNSTNGAQNVGLTCGNKTSNRQTFSRINYEGDYYYSTMTKIGGQDCYCDTQNSCYVYEEVSSKSWVNGKIVFGGSDLPKLKNIPLLSIAFYHSSRGKLFAQLRDVEIRK